MNLPQNILKCGLLALLVGGLSLASQAQNDRKSPHVKTDGSIGTCEVSLTYGSPYVKDRKIWGDLVPYDKVWRTGADEATTIEISQNLMIEGQDLPAGKYGLFTVPGKDKWTIVFNSVSDQWGAFSYDKTKDVLRVEVTPKETDKFSEQLTFKIKEKDGYGKVVMMWENMSVGFKAEPLASN